MPPGDGVTLRLLWPQWQGAGTASVQALTPEFPIELARRGYAVGTTVLAAVLPANQGPLSSCRPGLGRAARPAVMVAGKGDSNLEPTVYESRQPCRGRAFDAQGAQGAYAFGACWYA